VKKIHFMLVFTLLVGAAAGFGLTRQKDTPNGQSSSLPMRRENPAESSNQANNEGRYVPYSEDILAASAGQKVLFFHAPWCPQCRSIENGINAQGVPAGLTIIKVDYDTNQELRRKYGVTLQTTFVKVDDQGNFISRYVAYDEPTFDAVKRNYLK
jgi:thiol-disulfide isomerase/thioredoxin